MNGHEAILTMRRKGFKPAFVWLQDSGLVPTDLAVTISKTENPESLDLRFLIGTTVIAESDNKQRLEAMTNAAKQAKALRVIASQYQRIPGGRFEVVGVSDTQGDLTWQS